MTEQIGQAKMTWDELHLGILNGFRRTWHKVRISCGANPALKYKVTTWDEAMQMGKSYMAGDIPMADFLKRFSSPLNSWQKIAYQWCRENPEKQLLVFTPGKEWEIYQRGEYVEFYLPHQDHGGENAYDSLNGKTKVHVDND